MGLHPAAFAPNAGGAPFRACSRVTLPPILAPPPMLPRTTCPASSTASATALNAMSPADLLDPIHHLSSLFDHSSTTMHLADATSAATSASQPASYALGAYGPAGVIDTGSFPPPPGAEQALPELTPLMEEMSLSALGHDLLLFLAASVLVEPLGKILGVTPVLLYLILGFVAGPYGLSLFSGGTEIDAEIGDFGILFLLFVEGLNLSPERLKALGSFFSLGATQLLLSVGVIFFVFFFGGPYLLPFVQDVRVPIDPDVFSLLTDRPVVAFSIASAGALSSSAFVLPILKEKGWEKGADGIAALTILLLQDLAVAPLLVILPLLAEYDQGAGGAGRGGVMEDPAALGWLVAKATIGFGAVLAFASRILRKIFQVVASYGSAQTFVAASLLVACGMGIVAENLGLSATTGAFAAGVLLAESGYRAQIEADIKPFEGILLGVFFVTAGASLDPHTVAAEWPTLVSGIAAFIAIKFGIVFSAGELALGLTRADSARVALLLAGGGEFAFVVFKLAEDLGILSEGLTKLLTASVIISMSLTPLLGELAEWSGNAIEEFQGRAVGVAGTLEADVANEGNKAGAMGAIVAADYDVNLTDERRIRDAFEAFDVNGSRGLSAVELRDVLVRPGTTDALPDEEVRAVVDRFDTNGDGELQYDEFAKLWTAKRRLAAIRGANGSGGKAPAAAAGAGATDLSHAVVVCGYGEVGQRLCTALGGGGNAGSSSGTAVPYVAFSRDPRRISAGVLNGATVVYGDGASPYLVSAAGVEEPVAFVVTYVSEARCLEATLRLRDAYPDVPIYVRATRRERVRSLMEAGATEVVVEKAMVAEGLGSLVGVVRKGGGAGGVVTAQMLQDAVTTLDWTDDKDDVAYVPYTDNELTELANECGKTQEQMIELYRLFATSYARNESNEVQLAELRDELMRGRDKPLDDKSLADWMGYDEFLSKWVTGDAEKQWVSFSDFVRFTVDRDEADEDESER